MDREWARYMVDGSAWLAVDAFAHFEALKEVIRQYIQNLDHISKKFIVLKPIQFGTS